LSAGFTREGFDEMEEISATIPPNCSTIAPTRSNSPITTIKPSSKPNDRLHQQPYRDVEQQPHVPKNNRTIELRAMF
jgi:hypothetical protein